MGLALSLSALLSTHPTPRPPMYKVSSANVSKSEADLLRFENICAAIDVELDKLNQAHVDTLLALQAKQIDKDVRFSSILSNIFEHSARSSFGVSCWRVAGQHAPLPPASGLLHRLLPSIPLFYFEYYFSDPRSRGLVWVSILLFVPPPGSVSASLPSSLCLCGKLIQGVLKSHSMFS